MLPPAPAPRGETRLEDAPIQGQAPLGGTIVLSGNCTVPRGSVLTLLPGTRVTFLRRDLDGDGRGDSRLTVEGTLRSLGTPERPVIFTSAEGEARPGDWDTILFSFAEGNELAWTVVEYASYALHAHFSSGEVRHSLLHRNLEGCRMGNSRFAFRDSAIRDNISKGLNFHACAATVTGNQISGNGNGLFLFEKDAGTLVEGNNLEGNQRYNLRLDDFFREDLTLGRNWLGTTRPEEASETIYDGEDDPTLGRVGIGLAPAPFPTPDVPRAEPVSPPGVAGGE
jgi:parallel beta-helix repeat protein